jgi:splicing factor U2AF 35 kDa subunit
MKIANPDFFDECFTELAKYGEIEDMIVADNVSEHVRENIILRLFVKYTT